MKRVITAVMMILALTACGKDVTSPVKSLQITDLTVGTGADAQAGKTVTVDYIGWIYTDSTASHKGTRFDASADHGGPLVFVLGIGAVIEGWDKGIVGMKVGGTRELIIPPSMAYGNLSVGVIPKNSALVFDVILQNVQ